MGENPGKLRGRPSGLSLLKLLLGALLLWFLHERGLLDPVRIWSGIRNSPGWILVCFLSHGLLFVLLGFRWRLLASAGRLDFPSGLAVRLSFVSHFFSTCLPGNGAGDLVKGVLLSRRGHPFPSVLGTMAVDRSAGMAGLFLSWTLCLTLVIFLHPETMALLLPFLAPAATGAILLVASLAATAPIGRFAASLSARWSGHGRLGKFASHAADTFQRMEACTRRPFPILVSLALSLIIQGLFLSAAWSASRSLGIGISPLEAGALLPLASLANAIPLAPGGVGIGESVAAMALARLGHPANAGSELMVVIRLVTVIWAIVGGILYALPGRIPRKMDLPSPLSLTGDPP